jgi:thioredoxin-like negative regulator of GroEL
MKTRTLVLCFVLALAVVFGAGCAANDQFMADVEAAQAIVETLPPGDQKDEWLATLQTIQTYDKLAALLGAIAANHVGAATQPVK